MHSEWPIIVSGPSYSVPNYLTCSYVMSSLSAIATSPPAQFTPLRTTTLLRVILSFSINNPLLYP
ncbi:hypothetical protein CI238_12808 [Colletotrichum incanum]|uniref:Uncharacterized protein n=1 Tax=Colletotrichum incanum TaxID=1573173 RepID=A0A166LGX4_COLIC|nr:hypothetical protein CI238_12808 [Colletotrichum incanum]